MAPTQSVNLSRLPHPALRATARFAHRNIFGAWALTLPRVRLTPLSPPIQSTPRQTTLVSVGSDDFPRARLTSRRPVDDEAMACCLSGVRLR